jgi:hypothetical protein
MAKGGAQNRRYSTVSSLGKVMEEGLEFGDTRSNFHEASARHFHHRLVRAGEVGGSMVEGRGKCLFF